MFNYNRNWYKYYLYQSARQNLKSLTIPSVDENTEKWQLFNTTKMGVSWNQQLWKVFWQHLIVNNKYIPLLRKSSAKETCARMSLHHHITVRNWKQYKCPPGEWINK